MDISSDPVSAAWGLAILTVLFTITAACVARDFWARFK